MSWVTKNLWQDLVYWGAPSNDGLGGITFTAPINIKGRWEDVQKKFIDSNGHEIVSSSIVYLGQDVDIGGWLFRGKILDIASALRNSPAEVSGAKEIKDFNKTPDINAINFERKAIL